VRLPTALFSALLALSAQAQLTEADLLPVEEAFALTASAPDREHVRIGFRIADGYYMYRERFRRAAVSPGLELGEIDSPPGTPYEDEFFGHTETYREWVEVRVPILALPPGADAVELDITSQGCADVGVCYPPHRQRVRVTLPAPTPGFAFASPGRPSALPGLPGAASAAFDDLPLPEEEAFGFEAIAGDAGTLLLRFTPAPGYYLYRDRSRFRVLEPGFALGAAQWPEATPHHDEHFGNVMVFFDQIEVPLPLARDATAPARITLEAEFQGCQDEGVCYPPMTRRVGIDLPGGSGSTLAAEMPAPAAKRGLLAVLLVLLGALVGGVILNLMPCVLPILSLKALGLAGSGESAAKARAHALWYTAGVLTTFAAVGLGVLALRAGGQALGWGFQLQQPVFVAFLVYVMLAIGLMLSGVFSVGGGLAGLGSGLAARSGPAGDFFTGVLAVVVASPCTAPFMGAALAFAFAAPPALALAVFLMLGLGLALPFLLIGFVPALARRLPKPGAWMEGFKQFMAFPMYLTAVWLAWVLARQRGADAVGLLLAGAVLLALALWWLERLRQRRKPVARAFAVAVLLLALVPLPMLQRMAAPLPAEGALEAADGVVPYSAERLAALRAAGRVVFINMTADWCVTCKANERRVLSGNFFREALAAVDGVYMRGDWTNVDPAITAFLEAHGAVGVPLYVVYPRDGGAGQVLPLVLSEGIVRDALARAAGDAR
jgi:thiol:disulfide interchange protein DsbD